MLPILVRILDKQKGRQKSWLLFLTSRTDADLIDDRHRNALEGLISANARRSANFTAALELAGSGAESAFQRCSGNIKSHIKIFGIAFSKWLIKMQIENARTSTVEIRPSFFYRIHGIPDMISLSYKFSPGPPIPDPSNLASFGATQANLDEAEIEMAEQMAEALCSIEDLDQIWMSPRVFESIHEETARLLADLSFDEVEYKRFDLEKREEISVILTQEQLIE